MCGVYVGQSTWRTDIGRFYAINFENCVDVEEVSRQSVDLALVLHDLPRDSRPFFA